MKRILSTSHLAFLAHLAFLVYLLFPFTVFSQVTTDDSIMVGTGTDDPPFSNVVLPDCDDTAGQHLNYDTGTNEFDCGDTAPSAATLLNGSHQIAASSTNESTSASSDTAIAATAAETITKTADQFQLVIVWMQVTHSIDQDTCCARIYKDPDGGADGYVAWSPYVCVTPGIASTGGNLDALNIHKFNVSSEVDPDYKLFWQETGGGTCYTTQYSLEVITLDY